MNGEPKKERAVSRKSIAPPACVAAISRCRWSAIANWILFLKLTTSPSIDAKLINRMSMRSDIKRTPIFGLGCVGGAAGIARAADYLRAFPSHTALLLSVELCSLTLQLKDHSIANVIASGLFADGAAAVMLRGGACADNTSI